MTIIDRIEQARVCATRWHALNSLASTQWDAALAQARVLEALPPSQRGVLHGALVTIKDLFAVPHLPMQAGTRAKLPASVLAPELEASAVRRLREAGAIVLGKTNMHEVALGATGENAYTGDVVNGFDARHQAGGSSSGAGVAVACGIGDAALGTDTGGSIRIPAAFSGVVGFKPSFGAVPLDGALPLSWSFDHAGPLTNTVEQARAFAEVLTQRSLRHAAAGSAPCIAVPARWLQQRMDERVGTGFQTALQVLARCGARLIEVDTAAFDDAWRCYSTIVRAQAAHIHREALTSDHPGFSEAVLAPLRLGQALSAQDYLQARALRLQVRNQLRALLNEVDAMALPTTAIAPPVRGTTEVVVAGKQWQVRELVLGQTLPFNVAGVPALSLPIRAPGALTLGQGLQHWPVGLQLVSGFDTDARLLAIGAWVERGFQQELSC